MSSDALIITPAAVRRFLSARHMMPESHTSNVTNNTSRTAREAGRRDLPIREYPTMPLELGGSVRFELLFPFSSGETLDSSRRMAAAGKKNLCSPATSLGALYGASWPKFLNTIRGGIARPRKAWRDLLSAIASGGFNRS